MIESGFECSFECFQNDYKQQGGRRNSLKLNHQMNWQLSFVMFFKEKFSRFKFDLKKISQGQQYKTFSFSFVAYFFE